MHRYIIIYITDHEIEMKIFKSIIILDPAAALVLVIYGGI